MDNPNHVRTRIKNVGSHPHILYDVMSRPILFSIGEEKDITLPVREANRIRELALRGGNLLVVNASEVRKKRLRLSDIEDEPAEQYVKQALDDKKRFGDKSPRPIIRPEITTPEQLVAAMSDGEPLPYNHYVSVAYRVLPQGTFRNTRPSKAVIDRALEEVIKRRRR
jgi:hypothetical protein